MTERRPYRTIEHMFDTSNAERDPEVAELHEHLNELAGEDFAGWSSDSLSTRLVGLVELRERLDAEITSTAATWTRRRAWEADGALSPTAWLTHRAPLSPRNARRVVKAARLVNHCNDLREALADGVTTTSHIDALASVMNTRRERLLPEHGGLLAKQAATLSIAEFGSLARRWAVLADDQLSRDTHHEEPVHNEMKAAITIDGRVDGTFNLDPISGKELLSLLDHLEPPDLVDGPEPARSLSQRRGDALAQLAAIHHQGGKAGANPPSLDALVDVATLTGTPPDLAKVRCDLEGIGPITRQALDQIGCGATLRRVVMAGDSTVLDMGRKVRFATPSQTRAIKIRDGGCVFPSCDRPPDWCDIHHIDQWAAGGRTDVARMCCLCRRHHTLIHNTDWTVTTEPDGTFTATHPIRAP